MDTRIGMSVSKNRKMRAGYSLLMITAGLTVMVGMLGLSADLGRMYIVRTELQSFVDAAATAATYELDGTETGIDSARAVGQNGPGSGSTANRWHFGTKTFTGVDVSFSTTPNGTYVS